MSGFEFNEDMALKLVFQRADDPEPIGVLDFSGPEMTFSGRADESAKAFFDAVIKNQVGRNKHLEDLRCEVERELAAALRALQKAHDAMVLAETSHGCILACDPPIDAWKHRCVDAHLSDAIRECAAAMRKGDQP